MAVPTSATPIIPGVSIITLPGALIPIYAHERRSWQTSTSLTAVTTSTFGSPPAWIDGSGDDSSGSDNKGQRHGMAIGTYTAILVIMWLFVCLSLLLFWVQIRNCIRRVQARTRIPTNKQRIKAFEKAKREAEEMWERVLPANREGGEGRVVDPVKRAEVWIVAMEMKAHVKAAYNQNFP